MKKTYDNCSFEVHRHMDYGASPSRFRNGLVTEMLIQDVRRRFAKLADNLMQGTNNPGLPQIMVYYGEKILKCFHC